MSVDGLRIVARSKTVTVIFDGPAIKSVQPAQEAVEFIHPQPPAVSLDLMYLDWSLLGTDKHQKTTVHRISDLAARVEVIGEDSERSLLICVDPDTGDVRVLPDGISSRRGLRAVRWLMPIHPEAVVIAPCVNGLEYRADRPFPDTHRFLWPSEWNAQFVLAERAGWSVMIHSEDRTRQFKALQVNHPENRIELGFDTESPGPLWDNRTMGGVEWRINAYRGDWKVPATRYRAWMERSYDLAAKCAHRPAWVQNIRFVLCWAGSSTAMLEAAAKVMPPDQTLIHLSEWRTDKYDVNYPEFTPAPAALTYMEKARQMGFHVMPHFNYFAVWNQNPFFQKVRDFQLRTAHNNQPDGWYWPPETHDYTRMAYIHPGLGVWRRKLLDVATAACDKVRTDTLFLDQTLCTWNADNGMVQGMNTIDGMRQIHDEFAAARPDLVIAGEGLNEISFQRQCFAQAHIYQGWGKIDQKHVDAQHGVNQFLWGDHTRLIGYYHLSPGGEGFDKGIAIYERMGALPTLVTGEPKHLLEPDELTRRVLNRAQTAR